MSHTRTKRDERSKAMAGYQITLAEAAAQTYTHPMMMPTTLKSPKSRRRDVFALSDEELDEIMGWTEEGR